MRPLPIHQSIRTSLIPLLFFFLVFFVLGEHIASGQTTSATDGNTPLGLAPGAAAGTYPLNNLEQIGPFNGDLSFALPIMHIAGRGAAGYTMMLRIDRKWRVQHQMQQTCNQYGCTVTGHSYYPTPNWWGLGPGFSPG